MKVIVDIPEEVYKHIREYYDIREYYEKSDVVETIYSYIYHGTPIPDNAIVCDIEKKIRDEIEESITDYLVADEIDTETAKRIGDVMTMVFKIIDRHITD